MKFFVGLHQLSDCKHFDKSFVSVNRLRNRKSNFPVSEWIMDSGAFTEISKHGHYRESPEQYVAQIERWRSCGNLLAAVSQDYMCEPFIVARTGLGVAEHQRLTIERYDRIQSLTDFYIMPVLQGYAVEDYVKHLNAYSDRLKENMWVGVGSVCKRNASIESVKDILSAIKQVRPDLRLHGFGLKTTALKSQMIWEMLYSADSMAWSLAARREKRDANDWREAESFVHKINNQPRGDSIQLNLFH